MATTAHSQHNYIKIFIILSVLTVIEVGLTFLGLPKMLLAAMHRYRFTHFALSS